MLPGKTRAEWSRVERPGFAQSGKVTPQSSLLASFAALRGPYCVLLAALDHAVEGWGVGGVYGNAQEQRAVGELENIGQVTPILEVGCGLRPEPGDIRRHQRRAVGIG